jgi:hypothetical protein
LPLLGRKADPTMPSFFPLRWGSHKFLPNLNLQCSLDWCSLRWLCAISPHYWLIWSLATFCPGCPWTMILLVSAF